MHSVSARPGSWLPLGLLLALVFALLGCDRSGGRGAGASATDTGSASREDSAAARPTATRDGTWVVQGEGTAELVRIELRAGKATIRYGERSLVGEPAGPKRRYHAEGSSELRVEVKDGGDKLKLKDAQERLLWKVKLDTDKVKLSDSEEGEAKLSLKAKDEPGEFKVKRGEEEIGKVTFEPSTRRVKVKDATGAERFRAEASEGSAAYGVLLATEIPEEQRYIIMAELLARGR
jgi:hypothetical protein